MNLAERPDIILAVHPMEDGIIQIVVECGHHLTVNHFTDDVFLNQLEQGYIEVAKHPHGHSCLDSIRRRLIGQLNSRTTQHENPLQ